MVGLHFHTTCLAPLSLSSALPLGKAVPPPNSHRISSEDRVGSETQAGKWETYRNAMSYPFFLVAGPRTLFYSQPRIGFSKCGIDLRKAQEETFNTNIYGTKSRHFACVDLSKLKFHISLLRSNRFFAYELLRLTRGIYRDFADRPKKVQDAIGLKPSRDAVHIQDPQ